MIKTGEKGDRIKEGIEEKAIKYTKISVISLRRRGKDEKQIRGDKERNNGRDNDKRKEMSGREREGRIIVQ